MKKTLLFTLITLFSLSILPIPVKASSAAIIQIPVPSDSLAVQNNLRIRLLEIQSMDKTGMNFREKSKLRNETRSIEKQLAPGQGGLYVSAGALLIIIIVLLIILI